MWVDFFLAFFSVFKDRITQFSLVETHINVAVAINIVDGNKHQLAVWSDKTIVDTVHSEKWT